MLNQVKKVLAVLGLAAAAVFICSIFAVIFTGFSEIVGAWIYGSLSVFLVLGLTAVVINYLQNRAEQARKEQENKAE